MAHTKRGLKLDENWDLTLEKTGNIAVINDQIAIAQNVSNEARLFTNDAYFSQDKGISHFNIELGRKASQAMLRSNLKEAALRVADVREVLSIDINDFNLGTRTMRCDIRFIANDAEENADVTINF